MATAANIGSECFALWIEALLCGLGSPESDWECTTEGTPDFVPPPCQAEYDAFTACEY